MNKKPHSISVPAALYPADVDYINRAIPGENFSKKLRILIDEHRNHTEGIARYADGELTGSQPGALLLFEKTDDETTFNDIPFKYDKKKGWRGLQQAAAEAGFKCQVYQHEGYVAVWVLKKAADQCVECKKKIQEFVVAL